VIDVANSGGIGYILGLGVAVIGCLSWLALPYYAYRKIVGKPEEIPITGFVFVAFFLGLFVPTYIFGFALNGYSVLLAFVMIFVASYIARLLGPNENDKK